MRLVIQRVKQAQVTIKEETVGAISLGLVGFLAIKKGDQAGDIDYLVNKLVNLRIFEDNQSKLNKSLQDIGGDILVVSQFTLYGNCRKGSRPSFSLSLEPEKAKVLYEQFVKKLREKFSDSQIAGKVATGEFQAKMEVALVNDGPVTLILDS